MRVGFLGAGLIATYHSKRLRRGGAVVERAGVFDPDRARADAFAAASGHTVCAGEDEVLDGCDAVYVCTWTSEHRRLVEAAAARGLAVFCEKPLATTLDDARAMADAVGRAGVTNMVGLVLRRAPALVWMRHLVADPAAGPAMSVVLRDDQFIPVQGHYGSTWRADVARAGAGTLLEHSIHDLDVLESLCGPITSVSAATANHHGHPGIEDVATVSARFACGALGTLASVWHDVLSRPSLRRIELLCARRWVALDGDEWDGPVRWSDDAGDHALGGPALHEAVAPLLDEAGTNADVAFVVAAAEGRPCQPDLAAAVRAHELADACYRSAAAMGAVVAT